jgi:hypothetical protein
MHRKSKWDCRCSHFEMIAALIRECASLLSNMSLTEEQSPLEEALSPTARKNSVLAVSFVTPSSKKGNCGGDQIIDEDLFVNERKPSSMTVPKMHLNNCEHMLILVIVKMIHSAVYTCSC